MVYKQIPEGYRGGIQETPLYPSGNYFNMIISSILAICTRETQIPPNHGKSQTFGWIRNPLDHTEIEPLLACPGSETRGVLNLNSLDLFEILL